MINASEAVGAQGTVTLTVGHRELQDPQSQMLFGEPTQGGMVYVQVQDDGPGIPPEVVTAMFGSGYSTKGRGRGFGLASVANIVQRYQGNIDVKTDAAGTQFTVYLPAHPLEDA